MKKHAFIGAVAPFLTRAAVGKAAKSVFKAGVKQIATDKVVNTVTSAKAKPIQPIQPIKPITG